MTRLEFGSARGLPEQLPRSPSQSRAAHGWGLARSRMATQAIAEALHTSPRYRRGTSLASSAKLRTAFGDRAAPCRSRRSSKTARSRSASRCLRQMPKAAQPRSRKARAAASEFPPSPRASKPQPFVRRLPDRDSTTEPRTLFGAAGSRGLPRVVRGSQPSRKGVTFTVTLPKKGRIGAYE